MLVTSVAEDAELEKWRTAHGRCRLPDNAPPARSLPDVIDDLPRLMGIFLDLRLRAQGQLGPLALSGDEVEEIEKSSGLNRSEILDRMLEVGAALGHVHDPLDNVAAAVETLQGGIYVGAPLLWKGQGVKFHLHAVQAAVLNAWAHNDTQIQTVMTEASPCACCRQLLRETWVWSMLKMAILPRGHAREKAKTVRAVAVNADGLRVAGMKGRFLGEPRRALDVSKLSPDDLPFLAAEGAAYSYAPYSRNYAGVVLRTHQGSRHQGRYAETCESLASVTAIEGACSNLVLCGFSLDDIAEIALVETRGTVTQFTSTQKVAKGMNDKPFRFTMLS